MNKYGIAAVEAVRSIHRHEHKQPRLAWDAATARIFGAGNSSQRKGCPRDAFLSLCEVGLIAGVPPGSYTRSVKNKRYALDAISILNERPLLARDPERLWRSVMRGEEKVHNSQMDVVIALWNNNFIAKKKASPHAQ
jgi:hypothetical protein